MDQKDDNSQKHENKQIISEETTFLSYKTIQSSKHQPNLKLNLKVIEESEENSINTEEELLVCNSSYIIEKKTDLKKENARSFTRKFSNVSTNFSDNLQNLPEITGFSPMVNLSKSENDTSHIFFGREIKNKTPMNDYFNGTERYFIEKNPEKNEYKKSNNYIKKDIYYRRYFESSKQINSFRSLDLSDDNKNSYNNTKKTATPKNSIDILCSLRNYLDDVDDKNKKSTSSKENNIPLKPKIQKINPIKSMNMVKGKFDIPVYYYGYFPVDSKYYI